MTSIDAIAALASAPVVSGAQPATSITPQAANGFAEILSRELSELNTSVTTAETAMSNLAAGKSVELHEVMIALQQARMSVQTFVQIRNKLLESYQDLMRMQL